MRIRSALGGLLAVGLCLAACPVGTAQAVDPALDVWVSKAQYAPGEVVDIEVAAAPGTDVELELNHLGHTITTQTVTTDSSGSAVWSITPPPKDFQGYMVHADAGSAAATTAVDVSSTWTRYPRMGYLDRYSADLDIEQQRAVLDELSRDYHLNVLQFYDWMWRHEQPIERVEGALPATWTAWNGDVISPATVKSFIQESDKLGIASLPYSMSYAALQGYEAQGVSADWRLQYRSTSDDWKFEMWPKVVATTLWIMDPSNHAWVDHMQQRYKEQIQEFGFDGTHLDQLGNWGAQPDGGMMDTARKPVDLRVAFEHLVDETKGQTNSPAGLNAVDGFGSLQLAESTSDYLYSELWARHETWQQMHDYLQRQRIESGGKPHIIAAYANNKHLSGQTAEAEDGVLQGGVVIDSDHPGYGGSGFVDQFGEVGQSVTVEVTADEARRYGIVPQWSNHTGETAWRTLLVDGTEVGRMRLGTTGSWDIWSNEGGLSVELSPGVHTVTLRVDEPSDGYINLDSITLSSFDSPSVKLLNSVLASSGAHHIEMGQDGQMLAAPYFPDDTKHMSSELRDWMQTYYDMLTGYESLLFGPGLHESGHDVTVSGIPNSSVPTAKTVWASSMHNEGFTIVHLVNMLNETDDRWRNPTGELRPVKDAVVRVDLGTDPLPQQVFAASPDSNGGRSTSLPFVSGSSETGNWIEVQVPEIAAWTMLYMGEPAEGHVINRGSKCLDVVGDNPVDGSPAQLWDCASHSGQTWSFEDGQLKSMGKCLDVDDQEPTNGTGIHVRECSSQPAQQWIRTDHSQYRNVSSGLCLDVVEGSMNNGARLHLWECHVGSSQKWTKPQ